MGTLSTPRTEQTIPPPPPPPPRAHARLLSKPCRKLALVVLFAVSFVAVLIALAKGQYLRSPGQQESEEQNQSQAETDLHSRSRGSGGVGVGDVGKITPRSTRATVFETSMHTNAMLSQVYRNRW